MWEKDVVSIKTKGAKVCSIKNTQNGRLSFSSIKLFVSIAMCVFSKNSNKISVALESISTFFRYQSIINTISKNLRLNKSKVELLRDFSRTTRIGELAQGITYIFAQDYLHLPTIVDFEAFLKKFKSNILIKGKTPDFIYADKKDYYYLIESKGHYVSTSSYSSTKKKLANALQQCDNGKKIVSNELPNYNLKASYAVCTRFQNELTKKESEVQFADPENFENSGNENKTSKKLNIAIARYHYASWFLLMGNIKLYRILMKGENIRERDLEWNVKRISGKKYAIFYLNNTANRLAHIYFLSNCLNIDWYGLRLRVLNFLMGKAKYLPNDLNETTGKEGNFNQYEFFADGTMIKIGGKE